MQVAQNVHQTGIFVYQNAARAKAKVILIAFHFLIHLIAIEQSHSGSVLIDSLHANAVGQYDMRQMI